MGTCYARSAPIASYDSPPLFPGGTVAKGTRTRYISQVHLSGTSARHISLAQPGKQRRERKNEKPCPQPNLLGCFPQNSLVQIGDKGT